MHNPAAHNPAAYNPAAYNPAAHNPAAYNPALWVCPCCSTTIRGVLFGWVFLMIALLCDSIQKLQHTHLRITNIPLFV